MHCNPKKFITFNETSTFQVQGSASHPSGNAILDNASNQVGSVTVTEIAKMDQMKPRVVGL